MGVIPLLPQEEIETGASIHRIAVGTSVYDVIAAPARDPVNYNGRHGYAIRSPLQLRGEGSTVPRTTFSLLFFMPTGTIKTKTDKGFGFIAVEGGADVFFHHSACGGQYESMQVGQAVSFDMEEGPKGPKASNVVVA